MVKEYSKIGKNIKIPKIEKNTIISNIQNIKWNILVKYKHRNLEKP